MERLQRFLDEIKQQTHTQITSQKALVKGIDRMLRLLAVDFLELTEPEMREVFARLETQLLKGIGQNAFALADATKADEAANLKNFLHALELKRIAKKQPQAPSKFGSRLRPPNRIFKQLIEQGLVTTETPIFGRFCEQPWEGRLTEEGYFQLKIGPSEYRLFSSFSTAASYAKGRVELRGWKLFLAKTPENEWQTMEYFRRLLESKTAPTKQSATEAS